MGVTCKPIGANKSIMAKLENELRAKEEANKKKKSEKEDKTKK